MTMHLFRNRWYRLSFQFMDTFTQPRCPLCVLLSDCDERAISTVLAPLEKKQQPGVSLKVLCVPHRMQVKKKIAGDDSSLSIVLKTVLRDSLHSLTRPRRQSMVGWRRWFERSRSTCPLCVGLSSQENFFCRGLIRFLVDTEFWKGFARAPLLCLDHLEKCLMIADKGSGFERLLDDQQGKLNSLLDHLIRFEATGTQEGCRSMALDWLADFAGPRCGAGGVNEFSPAVETALLTHTDFPAVESPDEEQLLFENEKLTRKVDDLLNRLNEVEARGASLHYQVSRLSDDNKRLAMGYTGANAQADGLKQLVQDLRKEIAQLKGRDARATAASSQRA